MDAPSHQPRALGQVMTTVRRKPRFWVQVVAILLGVASLFSLGAHAAFPERWDHLFTAISLGVLGVYAALHHRTYDQLYGILESATPYIALLGLGMVCSDFELMFRMSHGLGYLWWPMITLGVATVLVLNLFRNRLDSFRGMSNAPADVILMDLAMKKSEPEAPSGDS